MPIDEFALTTSPTDYHEPGTERRPDWLDDEPEDFDARAWENATQAWDETANFTGMDEYWAGMRQFDEGEERAWWNTEYLADEGDVYNWEDEGNYSGCNCPAFCVSNGGSRLPSKR